MNGKCVCVQTGRRGTSGSLILLFVDIRWRVNVLLWCLMDALIASMIHGREL